MNPDSLNHFFPDGVKVVFTDATENFALGPQAMGFSLEQKQVLRQKYQIDAERVFTIRQVHGNTILTVGAQDLPQQGSIPQADGIVTNVPGIILSVRTADCLPVFCMIPRENVLLWCTLDGRAVLGASLRKRLQLWLRIMAVVRRI